jgi:tRNA pseudouridine38-40 synthase
MAKYLLELSYLGTKYAGWQRQPNALSIQQKIEEALSTFLREPIEILGSSRTDAGVHAKQQFATFETDKAIDTKQTAYRINHLLPPDISIVSIKNVAEQFHARFDAGSRAYEYVLDRTKNPFAIQTAYLFTPNLDVKAMNTAAKILLQHTDFQCFSKVHTDVFTYNCTIEYAFWVETETQLIFHIKANRFLRGMVRAIVGTLMQVGLGKMNLEAFEKVILSKSRQQASGAVPAHGLHLVEVNY